MKLRLVGGPLALVLLLAAALVLLALLLGPKLPSVQPAAPVGSQGGLPRIRIETSLGAIEAEIDTVHAPIAGANFLRYVDARLYDGGAFHRTVTLANQPNDAVKIEVIQAAADAGRAAQAFPSIPLERTSVTGLHHEVGTLSMARAGPDTARDQFFICVTAQPALDFGGARNPDGQGFGAFGRVVSGMAVVRAIHRSPAEGQRLTPPVRIIRVVRLPH